MHASLDLEVQAAASHAAGEVVAEALDDLDNVQGDPIGSQDAPYNISADAVEGFFSQQIYVKLPQPLSALFIK